MLVILDLDDTIISSYMSNPNREFDLWHLLPGRREKIQALLAEGHTVVICSNQAGVAFGYVTVEQVEAKMKQVLDQLGFPRDPFGEIALDRVYACYSHLKGKPPWNDRVESSRRKPSAVMLYEAMSDHWSALKDGVLFVGNGEEDYLAAKTANVPFMWAHEFFGDPPEESRDVA